MKEWTAEVINRPMHALLQATALSLLLELPLPDDSRELQLRLCLLDIDNLELQSQEAIIPQQGRHLCRFDLAAYRDTIRASNSPVFHFELRGLGGLQERGINCLPVLSLTQQLVVQDVELYGYAVDNRMQVELKWSEPTQASHRCIRFWPVHRPWDRPYEAHIPDEAHGEFAFEAPTSRLSSGKYRLEFMILDPWVAKAHPQKPSIDTPGTVDLELASADARLQEIRTQIEDLGEQFDLLLERALILRNAGDASAAEYDLDWCFLNLAQGRIPLVLALAHALRDEGDSELLEPLRYRMFAPDRAEELLDAQAQGHVSARQLQDYLAYLPQLSALPMPTFVTLLRVQDPTYSRGAAGELVRRSATEGMEAILGWVSQGSLSDGDAVDLCRLNPEFAFNHLESKAANPIAYRLLLTSSQQELGIVRVVRPGMWVYSDVGWGRVNRIEDSSSGMEVEAFLKSKLDYRLDVRLRPEGDAEPVVIDLQNGIITFVQAESICTCTKCHHFSTSRNNWGVIIHQHNRAVHGGIGPGFVYEDQTKKPLQEWKFSNVPPRNQFA